MFLLPANMVAAAIVQNRRRRTIPAPASTSLFVSKTGSDANDGLSSGAPVLTFANVMSKALSNAAITTIIAQGAGTWARDADLHPQRLDGAASRAAALSTAALPAPALTWPARMIAPSSGPASKHGERIATASSARQPTARSSIAARSPELPAWYLPAQFYRRDYSL
jgi:hypothetical protein